MAEDKLAITGEPQSCSDGEFYIHLLRSLLHYHERVMMNQECPAASHGEHGCEGAEKLDGKCPKVVFTDSYAEALSEAIRCIEIVHKDELFGG